MKEFRVAPRFETRQLEEIFHARNGIFDRHKVFKMLLTKRKITEELIDMLMTWRHSGFNVFCDPRILRFQLPRFTRLWRDYLYCDPDLYASGVLPH